MLDRDEIASERAESQAFWGPLLVAVLLMVSVVLYGFVEVLAGG